jgi:hypothetical protein
VPALIGDLAASAERRLAAQLSGKAGAVLRRGIAATTRVSTVTGNHNNRCTEMNDQANRYRAVARYLDSETACLDGADHI